jgi:uncharacterized PurR-regulated membrane protein YhhQ (DUF165 family)
MLKHAGGLPSATISSAGSITQGKKMKSLSAYLPFVAAMALVVVASNVLVQFPMQGTLGRCSWPIF